MMVEQQMDYDYYSYYHMSFAEKNVLFKNMIDIQFKHTDDPLEAPKGLFINDDDDDCCHILPD